MLFRRVYILLLLDGMFYMSIMSVQKCHLNLMHAYWFFSPSYVSIAENGVGYSHFIELQSIYLLRSVNVYIMCVCMRTHILLLNT